MQTTVIIPTRGKVAFVKQCLMSFFDSLGDDNVDIVVIEGGGEESKVLIEKHFAGKPVRWMKAEDDWSYSQINNAAAVTSKADYLLLLNNDIICRKGFLSEMLTAMESRADVGIVGAKLLHLDNTIQHVGVVFQSSGTPVHLGYGKKDDGSFAPATRDDYYDSVTFACALIQRELWNLVGGLDEAYHFNYEDVDFCMKARERGARTYLAHKAVLVHLESKSLEYRNTEKHSVWRNLRIFRDRWISTEKLQSLCSIRLDKSTGKMREDRYNIGFVSPGKYAGVPWWRIELPARKMHKLGLGNIQVLYADTPDAVKEQALQQADVMVFQGFTSDWVRHIASFGKNRSFRMVYDYDDHPIHISPFSQAYRHFGCQEIKIQAADGSEVWLWRDGESGFDLVANIENRQKQLEIFSLVDLVTTTTRPLHRDLSVYNPNVAILPNSIDFDLYRAMDDWTKKPGPIKIGWHGGDNHYHDVSLISKPLRDYVNSHDVRVLFYGAYYRGPFKGIDPNKVAEEEWSHVEAFPWKLATLGVDVAVIPLADPAGPMLAFGEFKSNIKHLEYAALKVPCLVSAGRTAYFDAVDGDNCLTFGSDEEFTYKLNQLCMDADLRHTLAQRAYDWAREYYDLEKNIHRWMDAYESIPKPEVEVEEKPLAPVIDINSRATDPEDVPVRTASNAVAEGSSA